MNGRFAGRGMLGVLAAGGVWCGSLAFAGGDDATGDDAAPLAGPKVAERASRKASIVEREFDGKLKRVEQHPVLMALDRMDLSAQERAKIDRVLAERNAQLDGIVRENLRDLIEAGLAKQAGDQAAAQAKFAELMKKARPFLDRGPLLGELRPVMSPEKFQELKGAVDEYVSAAAQDSMNAPGAKRQNRLGATIAQGFEGFGQEVKASYDRVFASGAREFEDLIKHLDLTPEQESKVRQKVQGLVERTYGKPTKRQQIRVFLDVYAELTPEQRKKLSERIGAEQRAERSLRRSGGVVGGGGDAAEPDAMRPMSDEPDDAP